MRIALLMLGVAVATHIAAPSDIANAQARRGERPVNAEETEGVGCYWMRGRLHCARYCYIEVDGRRYCRERKRLAHPQAPVDLFEPQWEPGVMKLGGPRQSTR